MVNRRRFGAIRQLPSGRWQASYVGGDGLRRVAPNTFPTKTDADRWLVLVQSEMISGRWTDPDEGEGKFNAYALTWIDQRPGLRPRTIDLYRWLYGKYLQEQLGQLPLRSITASRIRSWRADLLARGISASMCAKAYRLLRAILNTAVDDGILERNPCRIRGAGDERAGERPVLSVEQLLELSRRMPPRLQALILVTAFGSLRWGEVSALRRSDVDMGIGRVNVHAAFIERATGAMELGAPKSRAGVRTIVLPEFVRAALASHLDAYVAAEDTSLIFTSLNGRPLRRSNFNKTTDWRRVVTDVGVSGLHFHDLRHTGNTLAAGTPGTSTRDLMERMGHDSMRAALIYQHATRDADRRIADSLDRQFREISSAAIARSLHGPNVINLFDRRQDDAAPGNVGLEPGAGDENRTRTVSLGS